MENFDFKIVTQEGLVVEINRNDLFRNLYCCSNHICFFNRQILGSFNSPHRTFEVWKQLKQAAADGEKSFTIPKE